MKIGNSNLFYLLYNAMDTLFGFDVIRLEFRPIPRTFSRKLMLMVELLLTVGSRWWGHCSIVWHQLFTSSSINEIRYRINDLVESVSIALYKR